MGERPLAEVGSSGAGGLLGAYCDCNSENFSKYDSPALLKAKEQELLFIVRKNSQLDAVARTFQ